MATTPLFTLVIPTLNEERFLPRLLADIEAQSLPNFEVILVDGQSTDQTLARAAEFADKFPLTQLSAPHGNVSFQRNLGAQRAKGEWVVFIDADSRIPSYFLLGLRYQLEKRPETDVFSCMIDSSAYSIQHRPIIDFMNVTFDLRAKIAPTAVGALMGARRSVFEHLKFNDQLSMAEDQEFVIKASEAGFQFRFFREPCYIYSMRRYKKTKIIPLLKTYIASDLFVTTNGQLVKEPPTYRMEGGSAYEDDWDTDHDPGT